ncbi:hypothetical protein OS493_040357 [Desmophyllum pertusum]|uniref:Uncharacterized protein n=1 Tax=Desmophyllum pertusum TaxID=174260 RepID=A0A9W9Y6L8_9CNID|nr:hypothetical protein OS493_040357 [Desmophyllum pertusum]
MCNLFICLILLMQALVTTHYPPALHIQMLPPFQNRVLVNQADQVSQRHHPRHLMQIVTQSRSPISLQASSLLHTLALQHTNTDMSEPQNVTSGLEVTQLRKESAQGMQKNSPRSSTELVLDHQQLKEKSSSNKNTHLSKDNTSSVQVRNARIALLWFVSLALMFLKRVQGTLCLSQGGFRICWKTRMAVLRL